MEGVHEIGEIAETDVQRDVGYGLLAVSQQISRAPQTAPDQVLVGCDADHAGEHPQEMEQAHVRETRRSLQVYRIGRMRIDPERNVDDPPPVAQRRLPKPFAAVARDSGQPMREQYPDLIEPDIRFALDSRLGQLSQDSQLRDGRKAINVRRDPGVSRRVDKLGRESKGKSYTADARIVRADVLRARPANQHGSGHQVKAPTPWLSPPDVN